MANSPDQLDSSGSTLFAKTGHVVFSKRRVNLCLFLFVANSADPDRNPCLWSLVRIYISCIGPFSFIARY